jgi:hypothetical protein
MLSRIRALIKQAVPDVVEEWEMARRPGLVPRRHALHRRDVQERREGDVRQGRFARGSCGLFNSSLEGNVRRAIDVREHDQLDEGAFKTLIRAAAALNAAR